MGFNSGFKGLRGKGGRALETERLSLSLPLSLSLSMGALRRESGGTAPLLRTKATLRKVKEGPGNEASLSL